MNPLPNVTAGQLAQAAGCVPDNPCYPDCCDAWQADLDEWDSIEERDRRRILEHVEWIQGREWL